MAERKQLIVMVDDSEFILAAGKKILSEDYDVITMSSGVDLLNLSETVDPDLILLDIEMPVLNGYEVLDILKNKETTAHIPVIFLTSFDDSASELMGLSKGAVDYIKKPFSAPLLAKRIELHLLIASQRRELSNYNENLLQMVEEKTHTIIELQNAVLGTIAELVESRDDITGKHVARLSRYLELMIEEMLEEPVYAGEVSSWNRALLYQSAQLHDVGKIAIRDNILLKPGKLTAEEFETIKEHTTFGVKVFSKIESITSENSFLEYAKIIAGSHHEKWDGSGYPLGLSGEDIPLLGRLTAIVDVYDALTNERPYKRAFSHEEAVEIIKNSRGSHFDPRLTDIFLRKEAAIKHITEEPEFVNTG